MSVYSLADWINQLLLQPIDELNRKYTYSQNDIARKEVESLPEMERMRYGSSEVSIDIVQQLHLKVREQECEAPIWDAILFSVRGPLPTEVAHDLIDRDIIVSQLGHKRQHDEVQLRLASLVDEALLTLIWDMFTKPTYSAADFQSLLAQHPAHWWLLDKWEHWALLSPEVREMEKETIFHCWAWEHPKGIADPRQWPREIPSPEQYLEILAERKQEQARAEHAEQQERLRAEQAAEARHVELQLLCERVPTHEELERIFSVKDSAELLSLARNRQVPSAWIQKLMNCHHVKGARQIREAAQENFLNQLSQEG